MFGSKRSLFSAERGSTTSWLAGITSVALLIGTVALPAVATEGDPAAPPVVVEEVQDPAVEVLPETTPVEDPAPEEVVAEEVTPVEEPAPEVVAADPAPSVDEPEVVEEPAVEAPATEAVIDQPLETVAEEPAPIVGERTDALTAEDVKSAEPAASSTDGDTPDNNSPPIDDAPAQPAKSGRIQTMTYTTTTTNPNLADKCGIDIALVLDTSGSIGGAITDLRTATDAFLDSVKDTGSRVSITTFSTSAVVRQTAVALTSANVAAVKATYNSVPSDGWTNFQDAFLKAQSTFNGFNPANRPDLVVFITDGNPNTTNTSGGGGANLEEATNPAITLANAFKTAGAHMFGIAVGTGINLTTIQRVTDNPGTALQADASNFLTADWVQTPNYTNLKAQLRQIATALCGSQLNITKYAQKPGDDSYTKAAGFEFKATVTLLAADGNWTLPSVGAITKNVASSKSDTTDANGLANFGWKPKAPSGATVVLEETATTTHTPQQTLVCTPTSATGVVGNPFNVSAVSGKWTLEIANGVTLDCTAKNDIKKRDLSITKTVVNSEGLSPLPTFTVDVVCKVGSTVVKTANNVVISTTTPGTVTGVPTGAECTVVEDAPSTTGWSWTTSYVPADGKKVVTEAGPNTVAVTNTVTKNKRDLSITKTVVNSEGLSPLPTFTVDVVCKVGSTVVKTANNVVISTTTPGTVTGVPTGAECTVVEDAPSTTGWSWTTSYVPADGKKVVTEAGPNTVAVTNTVTKNKRDLSITKTVVNSEGLSPLPTFTVDVVCKVGSTVVKTANNVVISTTTPGTVTGVPTGAECTVVEDAPSTTGWSWTTSYVPADGKKVVTEAGPNTVAVTNTVTKNKRDLSITKTVVNSEGLSPLPTFTVDVVCKVGSTVVKTANNVVISTTTPGTVTGVPTGAECTVVEDAPSTTGWSWTTSYVPADGKKVVTEAGPNTVAVTNTVTKKPGTIEVIKFDTVTEEALAGAVFQLWDDVNGNEAYDSGDTKNGPEQTTGTSGIVSWPGLAWGNYLVQEVSAPAGHSLSEPAIKAVTIDASDFGKCVQTFDCTPGLVKLYFANPPLGSIEIIKVDKRTDELLAGATFQLWKDVDKSGTFTDGDTVIPGTEKTTGDDGKATWTDLVWGHYLVQEVTPPAGYALTDPAIQPAVIGFDTFVCEDYRVGGATENEWPDCTPGVVELVFANPPIDIPKLTKTSDPSDGTAVEAGDTIVYTITVKNEGALPLTEQTLVDTLPTGATLDVASITPAGDTSVAGTITWTFDLDAFSEKTFTYKVKVTAAGFGSAPLVNTAKWVQKELERSTTHPVKAISAVTTSFCIKDAPYYSVAVKSQNLTNVNDTVTIRWYQANAQGQPVDAQGNPTTDPTKYIAAYDPAIGTPAGNYVDTYTLSNGSLDKPQLLWKGAKVDANGTATVWPGWIQPSPGVWQQVPSGGVRPGMVAIVTVNPSVQTAALYPPAAAPCANPPGVPQLDKTANPAEGTDVVAGQVITYSVKVTNTGGSTFTGPLVDTLPVGFTADAASVTASGGTLSGGTITWQVSLAAGASATFSYSGTVTAAATGSVVNSVVLTLPDKGTISDSTTHPVAIVAELEDEDVAEEVVAAEEDEDLADTGAGNVGNLVGAALLALLAGGLMITFGRRRREE